MKGEYSIIELPIFIRNKIVYEKMTLFKKQNIIFSDINMQLTEFDEKIFYGLLILANERKSSTFFSDYAEIIKYSGILYNGATLQKVKKAIEKMSLLEITFEGITIHEGVDKFKIIESAKILSNEDLDFQVRDSRVKFMVNIKLNDLIYKEISYYDLSIVRIVKSVLAKRFLILLKHYIKTHKSLTIDKKLLELCEIIPLNTSKTNLSMSYKYLINGIEEIVETGYIESYSVIKNNSIENYIIKIEISKNNLEENLLRLLNSIKTGKIKVTSNNEQELLKIEMKNIALELGALIEAINLVLKECNIENKIILKDILIAMIDKIHSIKGIAKFILQDDIFEDANQVETMLTEYVKVKFEIKTKLLKELSEFAGRILERGEVL